MAKKKDLLTIDPEQTGVNNAALDPGALSQAAMDQPIQQPQPDPTQQTPQQLDPVSQLLVDNMKGYQSKMDALDQRHAAQDAQMAAAAKKGPGLKDILSHALTGFTAGAATPNQARGTASDWFRGGLAGLETNTALDKQRQDMAVTNALKQAEIRKNEAQAIKDQYSPESAMNALIMRGYIAGQNNQTKRDIASEGNTTKTNIANQSDATRRAGFTNTANSAFQRNNTGLQGKGFGPLSRAQYDNGESATAVTDPTQLTLEQQAKLKRDQAQTDLTTARTAFEKMHPQLAQEQAEIRKQMLNVSQGNLAVRQALEKIAQGKYRADYSGLDENGDPILTDPDGNPLPLKLANFDKIPVNQQGEVAQAQGAIDLANDVRKKYIALMDKIGPVRGHLTQAQLDIGLHSPEARDLQTSTGTFAAMNPYLHRMRGTQAYEHFIKLAPRITEDPENGIAAIDGMIQSIGHIRDANLKNYAYGANGIHLHPAARRGNTPPPTGGGQTKTVPQAMVDKFAQQFKLSPDDAAKHFTGQGYQITK